MAGFPKRSFNANVDGVEQKTCYVVNPLTIIPFCPLVNPFRATNLVVA